MIEKLRKTVRIVLSKPGDTSTPEGRSHNRYRRAAVSSLAALALNLCSIAVGLLLIPITLRYLGTELFGVWMILTSFLAVLSFADMGLGVGLQNLLIECYGQEDRRSPKRHIFSTLCVMTSISLVLCLAAIWLLPCLPWTQIIHCEDTETASQVLPATQAVLVAFAFGLPIILLQRISNAYQRGYWASLCLLIGRVGGFVFVLVCLWRGWPLWVLAGGYVAAPHIAMSVGWVILLIKVPFLRPFTLQMELPIIIRIARIGGLIVCVQISLALMNSAPSILIAHFINVSAVAPFVITQKLLGTVGMAVMSIATSLWGAFGEASVRGDWPWIRRTLRLASKFLGVVYIPSLLLVLVFGKQIIFWWTKDPAAVPSYSMLAACGVLCGSMAIRFVFATFLKSVNRIRGLAIFGVTLTVLGISIVWVFGAELGATGIVWAIAGICAFPQMLFIVCEAWFVCARASRNDVREERYQPGSTGWPRDNTSCSCDCSE